MSSWEDRLDVIETCTKVFWHTDQREWNELYDVFADKVLLDYTSLNGGEPVNLDARDVINAWSGLLGNLTSTQHMITNFLVDVTGDQAVCTSMFQAVHFLPSESGSSHWTLGGQYRCNLVRSDSGWRVSAIVLKVLWSDGNRHIMTPEGQAVRERPA